MLINILMLMCLTFGLLNASPPDAKIPSPRRASGPAQSRPHNGPSAAGGKFPTRRNYVQEETRSLDEIYQAALAEGGKLVFYAGGDAPNRQDSTKAQFEAQFPNMTIDIVVDYSKFHDARVDLQLANNALIPDVVQFQSIQNFPRWKEEGVLMQYKPKGWSKIYPDFRDEDGYHLGTMIIIFSNVVNSQLLNESDWPRVATDYLKPQFSGGKLAITYPNDDDAVLFLFKQIIDKYGWEWYEQLVNEQKPIFVRSTLPSSQMVANGSAVATMTTFAGSLPQSQNGSISRFSFPANDDPFVVWAQQAAIMRDAKNVEAAKLFLNWRVELERNTSAIFSIRTDFQPPAGFKPVWEYPNSNHNKFLEFMKDREAVESFRTQIYLYSGEPQGPPGSGLLGPISDPELPGPIVDTMSTIIKRKTKRMNGRNDEGRRKKNC